MITKLIERMPLNWWVKATDGNSELWFKVHTVRECVFNETGAKFIQLFGVDAEQDECSFAEMANTPVEVLSPAAARSRGWE